MVYEISGLTIEVEGGDKYLNQRMADYTLSLPRERERSCFDHKISIKIMDRIPAPDPRIRPAESPEMWWLSDTKPNTIYRSMYGVEGIVEARMDFSKNCTEISLIPSSVEKDGRAFLCAGHAFSQLVLAQERMVLHSSCIARNGRAVLFSAVSGTGKSTHTQLWRKYLPDTVYINDDTPVLRLDKPEAVYACGSPWSGKTALNENISAPLCGIVFLERGVENKISPIGGTEAFRRLLGETRKMPFASSIERASDLCLKLMERVPIYRLTCDISYDAVETVRRELLL